MLDLRDGRKGRASNSEVEPWHEVQGAEGEAQLAAGLMLTRLLQHVLGTQGTAFIP